MVVSLNPLRVVALIAPPLVAPAWVCWALVQPVAAIVGVVIVGEVKVLFVNV